mmetsp:Transcript_26005/g.85585  ORF Transcript_26005/g.85585 Transcript_26005/m.85585 type:complete len:204 (+) Transcript_26005:195-806(+)
MQRLCHHHVVPHRIRLRFWFWKLICRELGLCGDGQERILVADCCGGPEMSDCRHHFQRKRDGKVSDSRLRLRRPPHFRPRVPPPEPLDEIFGGIFAGRQSNGRDRVHRLWRGLTSSPDRWSDGCDRCDHDRAEDGEVHSGRDLLSQVPEHVREWDELENILCRMTTTMMSCCERTRWTSLLTTMLLLPATTRRSSTRGCRWPS